jgi:hypothetical protein
MICSSPIFGEQKTSNHTPLKGTDFEPGGGPLACPTAVESSGAQASARPPLHIHRPKDAQRHANQAQNAPRETDG